jgi:import inner membrane translocase subunit TIM50
VLGLAIAIYKPQDVRRVIKAYAGKDIPLEYAKVEAEMKARHIAEWKEKKGKKPSGGFSFGSLVGLSSVRHRLSLPLSFTNFFPPLVSITS